MVSKDFNHREDNAGTLEMELWYFDAVFRRVGVGKGGRWEDWEKYAGTPRSPGRKRAARSSTECSSQQCVKTKREQDMAIAEGERKGAGALASWTGYGRRNGIRWVSSCFVFPGREPGVGVS